MTLRLLPVALLALSQLTLTGCGSDSETVQAEISRPARIIEVAGAAASGERSFPARIAASQRADLSFRIAGRVAELLVQEGDTVEAGTLLARLDATDVNLVLEDRQARYDNAKRNFDRAKDLIQGSNISKLDYDRVETLFKTATTDLDKARQDIEYTRMRAPFAGSVSRRYVEQHEEVSAKQTVFSLQDVSQLKVQFDISETLVRTLSAEASTPEGRRPQVSAYAEFDDVAGERFPLTFKEVTTEADPQTQTYEVTFVMDRPRNFRVLPGMTATVKLTLGNPVTVAGSHWIPASAVTADTALQPLVWVVDPATSRVRGRTVEVGSMEGGLLEVLDGLEPGDRIVAQGAAFLAEDMKVHPMPESEQANPRADDPA